MRGPVKIKNRKKDLKEGYLIRLEIAFILTLLIFISAFKINIQSSGDEETVVLDRQEEIINDEIVQTKQELKAPPPRRPIIPVGVPNDEITENEVIELDSELDLGTTFMELPKATQPSDDNEQEEKER
ncbi:MAG TPA: hypothetical protein VFM80_08935 [Gracilimonas sp.]|uniref:hypothetical protein n=1 Tax=Gracilimonas sp. TaxID=1974203 RepID=UPI002D83078C|nr:hypothetical protein [Gracilimonas sp.]